MDRTTMFNQRFVGIDSSTKTGIAIVQVCQTWECPIVIKTAVLTAGSTGIERAIKIADQVIEFMEAHGPVVEVFMEGYSFASTHQLPTLVEIGTITRYAVMKAGLNIKLVAPATLKKFVTGKGTGKKVEMIMAAHKRWALDLTDDNECDAACLGIFGAAHAGLYVPSKEMQLAATKVQKCN